MAAFGSSCLAASPSASDYASIQEALDKNPGCMVYVPNGRHEVSAAIRITTEGGGLYGPGRIVQTNPSAAIIVLQKVSNVRICDIILTRAEGKMESNESAVVAKDCHSLVVDGVQVIDNRAPSSAISFENCRDTQLRNCVVQNYSRIAIDDRNSTPRDVADWGFAFNVIDGTGVTFRNCRGSRIEGNRILERVMLPTPEIKAKYQLGQFVRRAEKKGQLTPQKMWDEGYYNAWHQGSALVITGPELSDCTQILNNYIENAAQGIDIHADHVIVTNNIINDAFIGMKAMHGSRNIIIANNQFIKNSLWSIGLMPGASSHATGDNSRGSSNDSNRDGYSIVAGNIISDFGYGKASWAWAEWERAPIKLEKGQLSANPRLRGVMVTGNVLYDTGRDQIIVDGKPQLASPRYEYSILINNGPEGPEDVHIVDNILDPGLKGQSNMMSQP